jgi:hypothetical protein
LILSPPERIADYTARGWWGTRRIQDWLDGVDSLQRNPVGKVLKREVRQLVCESAAAALEKETP